jgi:hypothetical protein
LVKWNLPGSHFTTGVFCFGVYMKRFIDDKIWADPWFSKLSSDNKLIWIYLFTSCSKIGIWEENTEEVEYRLKKKIDWEKTKEAFSGKVVFVGKEWHIVNFIAIQYPSLLDKPNSPLHISVFRELDARCLKLQGNSLLIDYIYPMDRVQVKISSINSISLEEDSIILDIPDGKNWKMDFETYLSECKDAFNKYSDDKDFMETQKALNPAIDIFLTMKKGYTNFWYTEAGWKNKKQSKCKEIDWKKTIVNVINNPQNKVYLPRDQQNFEVKRQTRILQ